MFARRVIIYALGTVHSPRNPVVKAMGYLGAVLTFPASFVPAFVL